MVLICVSIFLRKLVSYCINWRFFFFWRFCFYWSPLFLFCCCCSVTKSCPHELISVTQHTRLPYPSLSLGVYLNSRSLSHWCHPTISLSVIPFSSCPQFFPASGAFPMSQFFASGGQSTGASASASVLPMNIQDWLPLELTGLIFLQYKELSRVFSSTQFKTIKSSALSLLYYGSTFTSVHDHWKKIHIALTIWIFLAKWCLYFLICCLGFS